MDETSGLSKGFGFVEMTTQDETDKAIKALNAKVIDGKKIRVKWSNQEKKQAGAEDFAGFATLLHKVLIDDALCSALGKNGRRVVEAEYTLAQQGAAYLSLFQQLVRSTND